MAGITSNDFELKVMKNSTPPKFLLKLFRWFCKKDYHIDIEGDLLELYERRTNVEGRRIANRKLFKDILLLFRLEIIKPVMLRSNIYFKDTLLHHLKISWRNLRRNKSVSFFGVSGLGLGLVCTMVIFLWVFNELSYNKFHEKGDQIFMVELILNGWEKSVVTPAPLAQALVSEYPQITDATRYNYFSEGKMLAAGNQQVLAKGAKTDPSFLKMFDFDLLAGNIKDFKNHAVFLTRVTAEKHFGNDDPLGETVTIDNKASYTVVGILEDVPQNSSFQFDFLIPFETSNTQNWGAWFCATFIQVEDEIDSKVVLSNADGFTSLFNKINKSHWSSQVIPLSEIYFRDNMRPFFPKSGDIKYVWIFSIAGISIFLLSCFNYITINSAKYIARNHQLSVERILGASRRQLTFKYLADLIVHTSLASLFSLILFLLIRERVILPDLGDSMNALSQIQVVIGFLSLTFALVFCCTIILVPIINLSHSSFSPKGVSRLKPAGGFLRKEMVTVQFCISISTIIATFIVQEQLNLIQNKDLGYEKEHLVSIKMNEETSKNVGSLIDKLSEHSTITEISQNTFEHIYFDMRLSEWEGKIGTASITVRPMTADPGFLETFSIELQMGRFYENRLTDESSVVINEEAVKMMGLSNPIGKKVKLPWKESESEIIGVVKDFNYWGLTHPIEPIFIFSGHSGNLYARVGNNRMDEALAYIETTFQGLNYNYPFEYTLLEDVYRSQHAKHERAGNIFRIFSVVAVLLSCLSLLGMITISLEQRTKEIGIRKVHGATIRNIVLIITKKLVLYLGFAFLLAVPITWYAMGQWIQMFAFRTNFSADQFLLGGLLTLLSALVTISFHTMKAAMANPIHALREQ